jgi:hypothetical protein
MCGRLKTVFSTQTASSAFGAASMLAAAQLSNVLSVLLMATLWLATEAVAGAKLGSLLLLLSLTGVKGINHLYNQRRYFHAALFALSEALLTAQLAAIRELPCYSILCDTSVGSEDHLLVYVQYLDRRTLTVYVQFLCAVTVVRILVLDSLMRVTLLVPSDDEEQGVLAALTAEATAFAAARVAAA